MTSRPPPKAVPGSVIVNGRFLSQRGSGVQRFALELVKAIDAELGERGGQAGTAWVLAVPPDARDLPALRNIEIRRVGRGRGHLWDQLLPFHCAPHDILLNLANGGAVLRGRSISIVHDAAVFRTPENFTRSYRLLHKTLGRLLALRAVIGTVSEFSRGELARALNVDPAGIFVIPNSCEHMAGLAADESVLARLRLAPQSYFLTIGSPVPNKNLRMAVDAFRRLNRPEHRLVIVGAVDSAVFGAGLGGVPDGVTVAGRLEDAEIVGLLRHARALVFPSLYEGFGIPPLEAMLHGCPVLASRIPPVEEVCGDAVLYFDPRDVDSMRDALQLALDAPERLRALVAPGRQRAALFSWRQSASRLMAAVTRIEAHTRREPA